MSEIMLGVLSMPDDLFWNDDPLARHQHNQIRLEAASKIQQLEQEIAEARAVINEAHSWLSETERFPKTAHHVLNDYLEKQK